MPPPDFLPPEIWSEVVTHISPDELVPSLAVAPLSSARALHDAAFARVFSTVSLSIDTPVALRTETTKVERCAQRPEVCAAARTIKVKFDVSSVAEPEDEDELVKVEERWAGLAPALVFSSFTQSLGNNLRFFSWTSIGTVQVQLFAFYVDRLAAIAPQLEKLLIEHLRFTKGAANEPQGLDLSLFPSLRDVRLFAPLLRDFSAPIRTIPPNVTHFSYEYVIPAQGYKRPILGPLDLSSLLSLELYTSPLAPTDLMHALPPTLDDRLAPSDMLRKLALHGCQGPSLHTLLSALAACRTFPHLQSFTFSPNEDDITDESTILDVVHAFAAFAKRHRSLSRVCFGAHFYPIDSNFSDLHLVAVFNNACRAPELREALASLPHLHTLILAAPVLLGCDVFALDPTFAAALPRIEQLVLRYLHTSALNAAFDLSEGYVAPDPNYFTHVANALRAYTSLETFVVQTSLQGQLPAWDDKDFLFAKTVHDVVPRLELVGVDDQLWEWKGDNVRIVPDGIEMVTRWVP